jgi:rhodanese-related sulfurtransferase
VPEPKQSIDDLLARARARLKRLPPHEAEAAVADGALLIDIRPADVRARDGEIPVAIVVERNVLEWRLDPSSEARIAEVGDHEREIIIFCTEGYASSLAAASLHDLGLHRATDLAGGFRAWRAAGLPVEPRTSTEHVTPSR